MTKKTYQSSELERLGIELSKMKALKEKIRIENASKCLRMLGNAT